MNSQETCLICARQSSHEDSPLNLVYQDEFWSIRHSQETDILGYLSLASRRHFLDLAQANTEELATYGPLLAAIMKSLHSLLPCQRIYTFTLAEVVPHFHVHIIPRTAQLAPAFCGRGILSYPTAPGPDKQRAGEICSKLRQLLHTLSPCQARKAGTL